MPGHDAADHDADPTTTRPDSGGEHPEEDEAPSEEQAFVRDLEERGEVVEEGAELTPGATHEYVSDPKEGEPRVRRRRFSSY